MKKIYVLTLLFAIMAASCKKSFIETTPKDKISGSTFYQTETQFRQALASTYVTLSAVFNFDFYMSEMQSDNTDYDYYPVNVGTAYVHLENIHDWIDDPSNSYTALMYTDCYVGVA